MGTNSANWGSIAGEILTALGGAGALTTGTSVNFGGSVGITIGTLFFPSSVQNRMVQTAGPAVTIANGTNSFTYNHPGGNCNAQSISVVGRSADNVISTLTRTVNITVNAPARADLGERHLQHPVQHRGHAAWT